MLRSALQNEEGKIRLFVVGLGMVGIAFIEKILNLDEQCRYVIETCGEETHFAYNRVALTEYFQHRSVDKLYLNPPEWYAKQDPERFIFHLGEQVTHIDHEAHVVTTAKGRVFSYDLCVLATGSDASLPPYMPSERAKRVQGVFVYRNIADLDAIIAYAEREGVKGGHGSVVGGGLLGLEAAKAVYDLPTIPEVTILNRQAYPLSRQLDAEAGEMVLRRIESMGVQVVTKLNVQDITTELVGDQEVFTGFDLSDGTHLPSNLVIFAIGIAPRDEIARASGIECHERKGILVDNDLKTSAKDIYAIGECASWKGNTYGLIAPGVEMADILAFNLTQTVTNVGTFQPRKMNAPDLSTKLKLMGVDVASFGDFFADRQTHAKDKETQVKITSKREKSPVKEGITGHAGKPPSVPLPPRPASASNGQPVWEIENGSPPSAHAENNDAVQTDRKSVV